jgi:hypothetical protein
VRFTTFQERADGPAGEKATGGGNRLSFAKPPSMLHPCYSPMSIIFVQLLKRKDNIMTVRVVRTSMEVRAWFLASRRWLPRGYPDKSKTTTRQGSTLIIGRNRVLGKFYARPATHHPCDVKDIGWDPMFLRSAKPCFNDPVGRKTAPAELQI